MPQDPAPAFEHPKPDNSVLLLVDVQGKLARLMHESKAMIAQQKLLIEACQALSVPIVWAEQLPEKLGATVDELQAVLLGQHPIIKSSFGCCQNPELMAAIEEHAPRHVMLAGIETHVCVWQTAAGLCAQGFSVHAIEDAISSRTSDNKQVGLRRMQQAGVKTSSVEMVLFEWMGNATHPQFKTVSGLIKAAGA
mgnify:CR=1 FL=1